LPEPPIADRAWLDEAAVEKQGRRLLALAAKTVLIGQHGRAPSIDYLVDQAHRAAAPRSPQIPAPAVASRRLPRAGKRQGMETRRNARLGQRRDCSGRPLASGGHGPIHIR
jgi:hypothetical protein